MPRNTTLSGSGSCKECLPCCFHIQTGPPTRARCLKIRPSVAFAPAGNAFPISRSQQGTPSWCLSRAKKVPLCCCGYKETIAPPSSPLLGTCFASFRKPFKLKTPKDRTAVSSVLSLSHTRACSEGRLQQRTYPLKMSIHLISEVPGAALCAYCSCMLECSGTD